MSAASNYLEDKLLDHALRVTAYNASAFTTSTTLYLALFNNTSTNTLHFAWSNKQCANVFVIPHLLPAKQQYVELQLELIDHIQDSDMVLLK